MNPPPEASTNTTFSIGEYLAAVRRANAKTVAGPLPFGVVHAVPVSMQDVVSTSGRLAEALYRSFELLLAAFGLIVTSPIMLLEAVLIR